MINVRGNYDIFKKLLEAESPSGNETKTLKVFDDYMEYYGFKHYYSDKIGNSAWSIGTGPVKILLSGHIDEVQARISNITKEGILYMISTGGVDKKAFIAAHVLILGDNGIVEGIVEKDAIHCEKSDARNKVDDIYKMRINIGCESDEDVKEKGIHIGSPVIYQRNTNMNFGKNQICSQGLDDKVGVFTTMMIMRELQNNSSETVLSDYNDLPDINDFLKQYTVIGMAAVQEETGCRGAAIAAAAINPDISIDFDVTFATDGNSSLDKNEYCDIALGKGAVIQFGPDKSDRLNNILMDVAKEHNYNYQIAVSRSGGTNTNQIQLRSANCETTLISVPNRNMHTPVEVCDWRDIQHIVFIVSSTIINTKI